jgi:hypothetical protein
MTQPPSDDPYGQLGSYPADPPPQPAYQGRPPDWREQDPLVDPFVLADLPPELAEEAALRQLADLGRDSIRRESAAAQPPAGADPALTRIGSPWLNFLRVMAWVLFGLVLLVGIIEDPEHILVWVLLAFVWLAVDMVALGVANDISAIRAKLYARPSAQQEPPAA